MDSRKLHKSIERRRKAWELKMRRDLRRYFAGEKQAIKEEIAKASSWQIGLAIAVNAHSANLEAIFQRYYRRVFMDFARDTYRNFDFADSFSEYLSGLELALLPHMQEIGTRIVGINAVTIERISKAIQDALAERATITEVQTELFATINNAVDASIKQMNAARVLTIARTEVGMLSSSGQYNSIVASGADALKWFTGSNPRDSHAAQNGLTVKIGQRFPNGLRYPLELGAPASEVINCNCSIAPVFD